MLQAGFADPVFEAQGAFRAILAALSEPGTIRDLTVPLAPPAGFAPATAIALLTLADFETPVHLAPALAGGEAGRWLTFHTGAPIVVEPGEAAFAVIEAGDGRPALSAFNLGNDQFPDRSTTIIVQCTSLSGGAAVTLSGPGIAGKRGFAPEVTARFWEEVTANQALYPLGVDMLLVAGKAIAGLPRSTGIEIGGIG
jgi:alpha-D-ribose 1-methylphosphonate 5-triphosphate synthase subunit PhnH